jgi:hypothetical protein
MGRSTGVLRIVKVVGGFGLVLAGAGMLLLPGPGWLTIAAGLALLADEFEWARRALDAIKDLVRKGRDAATRRGPR